MQSVLINIFSAFPKTLKSISINSLPFISVKQPQVVYTQQSTSTFEFCKKIDEKTKISVASCIPFRTIKSVTSSDVSADVNEIGKTIEAASKKGIIECPGFFVPLKPVDLLKGLHFHVYGP